MGHERLGDRPPEALSSASKTLSGGARYSATSWASFVLPVPEMPQRRTNGLAASEIR